MVARSCQDRPANSRGYWSVVPLFVALAFLGSIPASAQGDRWRNIGGYEFLPGFVLIYLDTTSVVQPVAGTQTFLMWFRVDYTPPRLDSVLSLEYNTMLVRAEVDCRMRRLREKATVLQFFGTTQISTQKEAERWLDPIPDTIFEVFVRSGCKALADTGPD